MNLREKYKKENPEWSNIVCSDKDGNTYYTDEYTEWLEELVEKLTMPDVGNRRKLLINYMEWFFDEGRYSNMISIRDDVDLFLKNIS